MPAQHPPSVFHVDVSWNGVHIGFSEVSGLTTENQATERRGLRKFANITLKRGVTKGNNQLFEWLSGIRPNKVDRRSLVISLLNEDRQAAMVWKVLNALPVKLEGPGLNAGGNEVAIESIELAHEGLELQNE